MLVNRLLVDRLLYNVVVFLFYMNKYYGFQELGDILKENTHTKFT